MNCIKLSLRTVFIIKDLLWQKIFDILCILSMILILMTGTNLLTMLSKKVYTYDNDRTNYNDTCCYCKCY